MANIFKPEPMKTIVSYYMKGQPKEYKSFNTRVGAMAFCQALNINPDCESCIIERNTI